MSRRTKNFPEFDALIAAGEAQTSARHLAVVPPIVTATAATEAAAVHSEAAAQSDPAQEIATAAEKESGQPSEPAASTREAQVTRRKEKTEQSRASKATTARANTAADLPALPKVVATPLGHRKRKVTLELTYDAEMGLRAYQLALRQESDANIQATTIGWVADRILRHVFGLPLVTPARSGAVAESDD
jgi:hypothetical protein